MLEALIEIIDFLFHQGYENILCGYDEGNLKSKKIGEKLGFLPYKVEPDAWQKKWCINYNIHINYDKRTL